jgi:hypothetical protein
MYLFIIYLIILFIYIFILFIYLFILLSSCCLHSMNLLLRFHLQFWHLENPSILVASHNQRSIEFVVKKMQDLGIDPHSGTIYFGQVWLWCIEIITRSTSSSLEWLITWHFRWVTTPTRPTNMFLMVPCMKVCGFRVLTDAHILVVPYLIRRAHENSNILAGSNTQNEVGLLTKELFRRLKFWQSE